MHRPHELTNLLLVDHPHIKRTLEVRHRPEPHLQSGVLAELVEVELRRGHEHEVFAERHHDLRGDTEVAIFRLKIIGVLGLRTEEPHPLGQHVVQLAVPVERAAPARVDPLEVVPGVERNAEQLGRELQSGVDQHLTLTVRDDRPDHGLDVPALAVV